MAEMARIHNLLPLFFESASSYPEYISSPQYEKDMQDVLKMIGGQMQRTYGFLEIYEKFQKSGICPVVLKGIICRQLYNEYADYRVSADEDILIRQEEFYKVADILQNSGYAAFEQVTSKEQLKNLQEITFSNLDTGLILEVHLNPIGCENELHVNMNRYFTDAFSDTREVIIDGVTVRTLGHTKHFLYLVLHTFKHFVAGGVGVRQFLDILMYDDRYHDDLDWDYLKKVFAELKIMSFVGDIFEIGNRYLGFHNVNTFSTDCPEALLEDVMQSGVFGSTDEIQQTAIQFTNAAVSRKKYSGNLLILFFHTAFPSKNYMVTLNPKIETHLLLIIPEWIKRWKRYIRREKSMATIC